MQEPLEGFDLRQPIEQRDRIDRIGRRAEPAGLDRLAQPLALLGDEDVREVVAGGRAVDARSRSTTSHIDVGAVADRRRRSDAGSARRSASVTPCVSGSSVGSPSGRLPSGSICAARWP